MAEDVLFVRGHRRHVLRTQSVPRSLGAAGEGFIRDPLDLHPQGSKGFSWQLQGWRRR